jgi:N-formylmaleamate deformylase
MAKDSMSGEHAGHWQNGGKEDEMAGWIEGKVTANGIGIHYRRTGGTGRPPILLLHGVTDNGPCWTRVARDLEGTYDVVMTDARGHGQSERIAGAFSIDLLAEDAAAVIRELGLEWPIVFGHSMGAITAAVLAADHLDLVRAIILEDPPIGDHLPPPDTGAAKFEWFADLKTLPREERLARAFREQPGWAEEEIIPWSDSKVEFDIEVYRNLSAFRRVHWRDVLARIACPVLLLSGDAERGALVTPDVANEAGRLAKNLEGVRISGAGHCVHRDRYVESMQQVCGFLRRHCSDMRNSRTIG